MARAKLGRGGDVFCAESITATVRAGRGVLTHDLVIRPVGGTEEQTHSGYSGALFLTARAA